MSETCSTCSSDQIALLVQAGSFFTKCLACGEEGPATSWIAIGPTLPGVYKAIRVGPNYEELDAVVAGSAAEIFEPVSEALRERATVRLFATSGA